MGDEQLGAGRGDCDQAEELDRPSDGPALQVTLRRVARPMLSLQGWPARLPAVPRSAAQPAAAGTLCPVPPAMRCRLPAGLSRLPALLFFT